MATSSTANYTTIQSPPTACVYAEMRYGSNGSDGGPSELAIGHSGTNATSGRKVWDENDSSFDSGPVTVLVTFPAGGGSSHPDALAVEGADTNPLHYSLSTYGAISAVLVVAGVQINASVSFTDMSVVFYKNGVQTEYYSGSGPTVDTTSSVNPVAEQIMTITPANSDNDKAVITATIELTAPDGSYPDLNDLFGQVFLQTASCSS